MTRVAVFLIACSPCVAHPCEDHCDPHSALILDASCPQLVWQDPQVEKAETELNEAYELAFSASFQQTLLEQSQQAWNQYRQANCELMSDRDGQPARESLAQCLAYMTRERTFELRLFTRR